MVNSVKIARQAYRRATQSTLAAFAENVFNRTNGVAAYQAIQSQVQGLSTLLENYQLSLAAARNGGRSEVLAKNLAQEALLKQLDLVADGIDALGQTNAQLVIDAGFTMKQSTAARYSGKLPQPVIVRAISTGKKGEIRITVDDMVASGTVVTHAVEYTIDRETGWQNGMYHTRRNFVATGLPRASELWMRTRSIGHGENKSEWSEPVTVSVL